MSNKPLIIIGSLLAILLGGSIILPRLSSSGGAGSTGFLQRLPEQSYTQIIRVSPDDNITAYVANQLGNDPTVIETLDRIDDFVLAQRDIGEQTENIMLAHGQGIQTSLFSSLGLLEPTPGYQFAQVDRDTVAYGPSDIVKDLDTIHTKYEKDSLESQLIDHKNSTSTTIGFLSRPNGDISAGLGLPFSQKVKGTIAAVNLSKSLLPQGDIVMYFQDGVIKTGPSSRSSLVASNNTADGSLTLSHILSMIGIDAEGVSTFLPFVLGQYLGDSIELLNNQDYASIYSALDGALLVEMKQTPIGSAYTLTLADPTLFGIFEKLAPFVQAQLDTQIATGSVVTEFSVQQLDWKVNIPEKGAFPYLSIYQGTQSTSIGLFTDEFDIYTLDNTKKASDILGTFSISPALLPITDASTGLPIWDDSFPDVEGKIVLDEKEGVLRVEMR